MNETNSKEEAYAEGATVPLGTICSHG